MDAYCSDLRGASWNGTSGYCRVSQTQCPANASIDSSAAQCVCNPGFEPNGTATQCVVPPVEERGCSTAHPVQPGTGRKRFTESDYSGAGAHPLNVARHYSSRWTDGAAASGMARLGAWDGGWRHAYQASLTLRTDGSLRAFRTDGTTLGLTASATVANTWTATGSRDTVAAIVDNGGQRTGYTYAAATDDSTETYDVAGKLLSVKARNGWTTTLTYSDATTPATVAPSPGLLISVKNQFGRELKFTYDSQGRIAELLPPGALSGQPGGSSISPMRYVYAEAASLGAGVPAQSQLTSVVWQDGAVKRYHYEDSRWPQAVTGITDEAGVRYGTFAYDAQGRVTRSELAGSAERLDFAYGTDAAGRATTTVTDYASGSAASRSYTFGDIGGVRYPLAVSAPCSLCGSTQQASSYDANGSPTKTIAHDGTVTFYAYDAKGRETERATFPSSYSSATTRPALSNATKVLSTQWHATFNLPTQVAEPNKTTTNSYDAKGMLTGQSWAATTDATGVAKFSATKTGSTYATTWTYGTSSLATTIVTNETAAGTKKAVETGRWTPAYSTNGDLARITNVTDNNSVGQATQYDAHGRLLIATTPSGTVSMAFDLRGRLTEYKHVSLTMRFQWTPFGELQRIDGPGTDVVVYEYDAAQRLTGVRKQLTYAAVDETALTRFAQMLRRLLESPISMAHAQVVLPPLVRVPAPFTPAPRGAQPVPTDPSEALMPSQSPPDPNRELARRLGDAIQSVLDRLLCSPECKKLQVEIEEWTGALRKRYLHMLVDKNNLFCTRPEGRNSWAGHQEKYFADQRRLRTVIARARALNCPYNPEADDWANRPPPICPA